MQSADVVVIGLGAMGSASTYQLARRGVSVIGIDRFSPPHTLGSSHGDSRISRRVALPNEGEECIPLAARAQDLWSEIAIAANVEIFIRCGVLLLSAQNGPNAAKVRAVADVASRHGIHHEFLSPHAVRERFPHFGDRAHYSAYFEPGGGIVRPEAAIESQLRLAGKLGATLRLNERVNRISTTDSRAIVSTDNLTLQAEQVILCVGPWMTDLVEGELSSVFRAYRQLQIWYQMDDAAEYEPSRFPAFARYSDHTANAGVYGVPAIDGPTGGMKFGTEQNVTYTNPDDVDRAVSDAEVSALYESHIRGNLVGIRPAIVRALTCLYTVTPDGRFVIGRHPSQPRIILVSPCSGRGFKFSAAIGEVVADIAVRSAPKIDLASFSPSRFI